MDAAYNREIERLYSLMSSRLFVYARSDLGNDALAEEAVQETFRIACTKPEELCTSPNPEGWLVNTLKYTLVNIKRSRTAANRILMKYISTQIGEVTVAEDSVGLALLYEDIVDLEEFKLLQEMVLERKTLLEMAQERGITLNACKKRVERARKILQKKIDE